MFNKRKKGGGFFDSTRQFVFIDETPREIIIPQLLAWGENEWWPASCPAKFKRLTPGDVRSGTRYEMSLGLIVPVRLLLEVTRLEDFLVERTFISGPFAGKETLKAEERANGTRVEYEMTVNLDNVIKRILWQSLYKQKHIKNVQILLEAMRAYFASKLKQASEDQLKEGS